MGLYLELLPPNKDKAEFLRNAAGAVQVDIGESMPDLLPYEALVCVIYNRDWHSAAFIPHDSEFKQFLNDGTDRRKIWLVLDATAVISFLPPRNRRQARQLLKTAASRAEG